MRIKNSTIPCAVFIILLFFILVVSTATRPDNLGSDTFGYLSYYNELVENINFSYRYEFLFETLTRIIAYYQLPRIFFLGFFVFLNYSLILLITNRINTFLESNESYRLLFAINSFLIISPFFFAIQTNVIRQGVAIFLIILAYLTLLERRSYLIALFFGVLAIGFHMSAGMFILISLLISARYNVIIRLVFLLFLLYVTGMTSFMISVLDPKLYNKLMSFGISWELYKTGVRYKFAFFTMGIGFGFHHINKYLLKDFVQDKFYSLLKIYWLFCIPFFILGFGSYSDRFLLPAWIYISILIAVLMVLSLRRLQLQIYAYLILFLLCSSVGLFQTQGFYNI